MAVGKRPNRLRQEVYKPDADDADGDGIVQDGTIWERPAGTRFVTRTGQEVGSGEAGTHASKLQGLVLVDSNNRVVNYRQRFAMRNLSVGERLGTLGTNYGTLVPKPE